MRTYTSFSGDQLIASGDLRDILRETKPWVDRGSDEPILIFKDQTGTQVDFNFTGTLDEVLEREAPILKRSGPGRPKLGVVSREISLLPRHWEWLEGQPNGASATLRRLVDDARKQEPAKARASRAAAAVGRFMSAMAGNRPNFEEAYRSLYAADKERFDTLIRDWPHDVREYTCRLAEDAFVRND